MLQSRLFTHVFSLTTIAALCGASPVTAQLSDPEIGAAAPSFTLPDTYGNEHALADFRGRGHDLSGGRCSPGHECVVALLQ